MHVRLTSCCIHSCAGAWVLFGVELDGLVEVEVVAVQAQCGQSNGLDRRRLHTEVRKPAQTGCGDVVLRELGR